MSRVVSEISRMLFRFVFSQNSFLKHFHFQFVFGGWIPDLVSSFSTRRLFFDWSRPLEHRCDAAGSDSKPIFEGGFEPLMSWVKGSGSSKNSHWIEGIYRILPGPGVSGPWICQSSLPGFFQSRTGFNNVFPGSQFSSQNFYGTSDLLFKKKCLGNIGQNKGWRIFPKNEARRINKKKEKSTTNFFFALVNEQ